MALNIDGTTGISGVDGSASAASIAGTDANTGLSFASDTVNINTGGTTRATVDSSGNVGIGTTSPTARFDVRRGDADGKIAEFHQSGGYGIEIGSSQSAAYIASGSGQSFRFKTNPGSGITERMRLESGGNLVWTGASTQYVQMTHSGDVMIVQTQGTSAGNHGMIQFRDGGGTYCGQITSHGTNHTTSYVTNSDYRLKQNEASISDGITRLKQLKPYRFEWKSSGNEVDGFFAHEAQAVVPESVIGTKDEVDSDNDPVYQGIDQSKLVPLLTAALQEAVAKIEVLETKVAALEAG